MNHKKFFLMLFLILLICLTIESISAENITDASFNMELKEINSYSDDFNMELETDDAEKLSSGAGEELSAENSYPLPNVDNGSVSGGVDFTSAHPWAPSDSKNGNRGNISYDIPSTATNIKSAYVYVNVYSGSGGTNYGAYANTSITTANGRQQIGNEYLVTSESSADGHSYIVNGHTTRCYSDYMIFYNVTDILQGLNGTSVTVDTLSYPMEGKSFDGRIKLISLFVAWDDGDSDVINYWFNAGQAWTDDTVNGLTNSFDLRNVNLSNKKSSLINVGVSSTDAFYMINKVPLFSESEDDIYINGAYYQYHLWDVTNYVKGDELNFTVKAVGGAYGPSFKTLISLLTVYEPKADVSVNVADNNKNIVYPNLNNELNITVNSKAGKYTVNLLADGHIVNSTIVTLKNGVNSFSLVDPTIRQLNESAKYTGSSGSYEKVNYKVQVLYGNAIINETSYDATILYNGYLGKDTYNETSLESFYNATVTGDIIILTNGTYAGSSDPYGSITYSVDLPDNSSMVKAFIYVSYCWASGGRDNIDMFNVTLNGNKLNPVFFARDQSNLNSNYGYGVVVFDATDYIINGNNVFDLKKTSTAVYPTTLVYMYNTTGSKIVKDIYISNGADLLGVSGGTRNPIRVDSSINVNASDIVDVTAYIFANGAQDGEAAVMINGKSDDHPWNGTSQSTDLYIKNITNGFKDSNSISVMIKSGGLTVLQQIIVTTKKIPEPVPEKVRTNINAPVITIVHGNSKNLVVELTDIEGKNIPNAAITIAFNGKSTTVTTKSNGKATLAITANVVPKSYPVKISYAGNDNYIKSSADTKVVVAKATPKFTAKSSVAYKAKAVKKYTVVLKTNKGKLMKNAKITIRVNCKNYIVKTNSKGQAIFKFTNLVKKGTYNAIVKYAGDKYYKPISKTVKVTVK